MNHLERIVATTREEVARRAMGMPMHDVQQACAARVTAGDGRDFADVLARPGISVIAEYKRRQAPPGIKITPRAFGRDRRMPITNAYRG